jgi:anti-sigma-K factor RskA
MRLLVPREGVDAEYVFQALRAESEQIRSACVRTDGSMAAVVKVRRDSPLLLTKIPHLDREPLRSKR